MMMSFADALVKLVSTDVSIWQSFVARSLVAVPLLYALQRLAHQPLKLKASRWVIARSVLLVMTWLAFYA